MALKTSISQIFWISFIAAWLTICGCASTSMNRPLPCREIHQVPGLAVELRKIPARSPLWQYVIDSSAVCHGNKKIR